VQLELLRGGGGLCPYGAIEIELFLRGICMNRRITSAMGRLLGSLRMLQSADFRYVKKPFSRILRIANEPGRWILGVRIS